MGRIYQLVCMLQCLGAFYAPVHGHVLLGVDNLAQRDFQSLRGKRVGLITNQSGVNAKGESTISVLHKALEVELVSLFAPEHGIDGKVKAGKHVRSFRDNESGLWVHSLYGSTRKPTNEMLSGLDVLVYDLQDIGCRSYTYISTLGLVMEAAADNNVAVYVLDRPNPLGGQRVEGAKIDPRFRSFVGQYELPYVYGLTIGELAKWINAEHLRKKCQLRVYKMAGWSREMIWRDTGLDWVATSPNIPTFESAVGYVATGLLGDLGISNGANQQRPFESITDARWKSGDFARALRSKNLQGVITEPYSFYPISGKWKHVEYSGALLYFDLSSVNRLMSVNYHALDIVREIYEEKWYFNKTEDSFELYDKINGSDFWRKTWKNGARTEDLEQMWSKDEQAWLEERKPFLLY
ncbi:MAG: DUF1343 domain-containing protein [Verrucomicrobiota bacterium]